MNDLVYKRASVVFYRPICFGTGLKVLVDMIRGFYSSMPDGPDLHKIFKLHYLSTTEKVHLALNAESSLQG